MRLQTKQIHDDDDEEEEEKEDDDDDAGKENVLHVTPRGKKASPKGHSEHWEPAGLRKGPHSIILEGKAER